MDLSKLRDAAAPATSSTPAKAQSTGGALVLGSTKAVNVLAAISDADAGPARSAFPLLSITGGNAGGSVTPAKFVPSEIADNLPQGKKPIRGVYLSHRLEITAWPEGYKDEQSDEPRKPAWSAVVKADNAADAALVMKACKAYQYTPGTDKAAKFDFASSHNIGHIRPVLAILMYLPDIDGVCIVQPPQYYPSAVSTAQALAKNADPATGEIGQFPAVLTVVSTTNTAKGSGKTWSTHSFDIGVDVTPKGKDLLVAFGKWKDRILADTENLQVLKDWVEEDTMTDEIRTRLRTAAQWAR